MRKSYLLKNLLLVVIYFFIAGFLVMLLWNWLLPSIIGLRLINYWEACGLILLTNFLFNKTYLRKLFFNKQCNSDKWSFLCDTKKGQLNEMWDKRCEDVANAKKQ